MSEGQLVSKRIKLDINNTYTISTMNFIQSSKPFAETIQEFLDKPSAFRPRIEHINFTMPDEETVLTHCIKNQFVEAVDALINAGSDPNLSSRKGVTPISAAAHKGNIIIMEKLIIAGAAVNAVNQSGSTALIQAAHFGHLNAVKLLLRYNASPDFANVKGTTALMRACQEGHFEISRCLVGSSVEVNRKNHEGMNALMLASQRGHADIVTLLIRQGAAMDEQTTQGSTALMLACKRGHEKCAEMLVTMGAEICMRDRRGRTAKDTATKRSHFGLLCWLDTQMQVKQIQKNRQLLRNEHLVTFRKASILNKLVLNPVDAAVSTLSDAVSHSARPPSLFQSRDASQKESLFMEQFMSSSSSLPFTSSDPKSTVSAIATVFTKDVNDELRMLPVYRHSSKTVLPFPGHADWQWSSLLMRVMGLPPGVFELVIDYMPSPRIWQWSLTRIKLRCKLSPVQAMLDISCVMDEILCDANVISDPVQKQLLVKINRSPQIHDHLINNLGMTPELLDSLCQWAEVQGMLPRCQEADVVFKPSMARQMLVVVITLYRWYRQNQSATKKLNLVLPSSATSDEVDGLTALRLSENDLSGLVADGEDGDGDLMEETDAGGEGSEDNDGDEGGVPVAQPQFANFGGLVNHAANAAHGLHHHHHANAQAAAMVGGQAAMAANDDDEGDEGDNLQLGDSDDEDNDMFQVG